MKYILTLCCLIFSISGCSSKENIAPETEECTSTTTEDRLWGNIIEFHHCYIPNDEQSAEAVMKYCKNGEKITLLDNTENSYVCQSIPNFQNTALAIGTYCYFLAQAPALSDVLTTDEKESGSETFTKALAENNMRFPTGASFEFYYKKQYLKWLMGSFQSQGNDSVSKNDTLKWYKAQCLL